MSAATPPGWPAQVHPPGSEGFERTAVAWLYDLCPPDLRADEVLRRHPVALARLAVACQQAMAAGLRAGLRGLRAEAAPALPAAAVTGLVELYAREAEHAAAAARSAGLVEEALVGRRWVPRL